MVRERKPTRPTRAPTRSTTRPPARRSKDAGSIWDTPRMKEILSQPVGAPMDLTPEEARAIVRDMIENPKPYDARKAERDLRELRKIRRMWGSVLRDVDA